MNTKNNDIPSNLTSALSIGVNEKVTVTLWLDVDVIEHLHQLGEDWEEQANAILKEWINKRCKSK